MNEWSIDNPDGTDEILQEEESYYPIAPSKNVKVIMQTEAKGEILLFEDREIPLGLVWSIKYVYKLVHGKEWEKGEE